MVEGLESLEVSSERCPATGADPGLMVGGCLSG